MTASIEDDFANHIFQQLGAAVPDELLDLRFAFGFGQGCDPEIFPAIQLLDLNNEKFEKSLVRYFIVKVV
jgi:hypothetical protein